MRVSPLRDVEQYVERSPKPEALRVSKAAAQHDN
jgi:hypothetical protein